jgi:CHAD domain-containing protein
MTIAADNPAHALLLAAIGNALDHLVARPLTGKGVHAARKAIKRTRAMLRLLRPAIAESDYRMENIALRDAGRSLSSLRDAKSQLEAFKDFVARYAAELHGAQLGPIRRWLLARHAQARRALLGAPATLRQCADSLEVCRERIRQWKGVHAQPAIAIDGLCGVYRKGRKAYRQARNAHTSAALHEWRKQVKYLSNASTSLRGSGVDGLRKIAERSERIAEWLGDDHDLAMLHQAVSDSVVDAGSAATVTMLIAQRRATLQRRALDGGRRLFARKPKRFAARLGAAASNS